MEVRRILILSVYLVCASCMRRPIMQAVSNTVYGNGPFSQFNAIRRNVTFAKYAENIQFLYYDLHGDLVKVSTLDRADEDYFDVNNCTPDDKFAILVHGWRESCDQEWMRMLVKNLIKYRGGCIMCMDYSKYSRQEYPRLVRSFDAITQLLTAKLFQMEHLGFNPNDGYMFGFSYGAQLASEAGRRYGTRKLREIDLCELAGPGFDYKSNPEHKNAAKNVQCIHTSTDKGTRYSSCHQNWKMGNCGSSQPAAGDPPLGSHGLCPYFYNNAFKYTFLAMRKPRECNSKRAATDWPDGFKMGYMERRKNLVYGELFAETTSRYPFTPYTHRNRVLLHANDSSISYSQQVNNEDNSV